MDIETTIYITLEVVIALVTALGNLLVCYVVLRSDRLRQKAMYIFVTSLALADISVAVIAIPFAILTYLGLPHSLPKLCVAMLSFILVPTQVSIFSLMVIAIERYIAIRMPHLHRNKLTLHRSIAVVACTWILSTLLGMIPLFGWNRLGAIGHVAVADFEAFLPNSTISLLNTSESAPDASTVAYTSDYVQECQFMQVMEMDFLIFLFAFCHFPPLLVSAVVYYIIFHTVAQMNVTKHSSGPPTTSLPTASRQRLDNSNGTSPDSNYSWSSTQQDTANRGHNHEVVYSYSSKTQMSVCESVNSITKDDDQIPVPHTAEKCHVEPTIKPLHSESVRVTAKGTVDTHQLTAGADNVASQLSTDDFKTSKNVTIASSHYSGTQDINERKATPRNTPALQLAASNQHRKQKREKKAASLLCLIVLCFVVCWMPIHILNIITRFDVGRTIQIPSAIFSIAILLSHANSAINFILYSWRLQAFRDQLNRLVLRRFRRGV